MWSKTAGHIISCQNGNTLSTVNFRDSVLGNASIGKFPYWGENFGCLGSSNVRGGGGIS